MTNVAPVIDLVRSASPVAFVLAESLVLYGLTGVLFDRAGADVRSAVENE